MKKSVFVLLGCAVMMTACNNCKKTPATEDSVVTNSTATGVDTLTYEGEGPAADGTYEYTLSLYGDSIKEADLLQVGNTPQGKDTVAMTRGLVNVISRDGKIYYRVNEDKVDSLTFLEVDANTLRMVDKEFKEPTEPGLITDLKRVK